MTRNSDAMTGPQSSDSTGILAATVVIFRKGRGGSAPEILMVIRSKTMSFAGGAAVFPGGRVDREDFELAAKLGLLSDAEEAAHRIAAIRETLEETGLVIGIREAVDAEQAFAARELLLEATALEPVLREMGWTLDVERVLPFARWFPKNERLSRLFDTRFYLYDIGTGEVDIAIDQTENTRLFWTSAADALGAAERGEISVIFPTRRNLERLAQFSDYTAAEQDCAKFPVRTITPFVTEQDGAKWLSISEDAGYPVTSEPFDNLKRG